MNKQEVSTQVVQIKKQFNLSNKDMAFKLGVSMHSVQAWCTGRRTPSKTMMRHIEDVFILNKSRDKDKENMVIGTNETSEIMQLQREQIILLKDKISYMENKAETDKRPANESWENMVYDALTYQTYSKNLTHMTSYRIETIHGFFAKLGYTPAEAEKMWADHHEVLTNKSLLTENMKKGYKFMKIDNFQEQVRLFQENFVTFFRYAQAGGIDSSLQNTIQTYLHKDGSEILCSLSCLWDIPSFSAKTKITFLNS